MNDLSTNYLKKKFKWFNRAQLYTMMVGANTEYDVCSRGFGKSEGIDAPRLVRNVLAMPRSTGAILSPTYTKLLANTLPAVCSALARMGYYNGFHYVVGIRPPKKLNFAKPLTEPFKWEYVMTWFNGTIVRLISFDRPMSANSMNLDWVMGFEAKYLNYAKIVDEVLQANRGNEYLFDGCPWHHGLVFTTDMPSFKSGQWILDKKKDMEAFIEDAENKGLPKITYADLIEIIKRVYREYMHLKQKPDKSEAHIYQMDALKNEMNAYRKNAVFYGEFDIFENLECIGLKRIADFKRDLPTFIFNTSILNICPRKVVNGFYSSLDEKIHTYESFNNTYVESVAFDKNVVKKLQDCETDGDLNSDYPLRIAFDANAAICNVSTGQLINNVLFTQNWQFVKTPRKLQNLCNDWCDYYAPFGNRNVVFFFDSTFINKSADGDATPFADIVIDILTRRGWNVISVYLNNPMRHDLKHQHIDMSLKGEPNHIFIMFNKHKTEFLFMAMEMTGIKKGRNGFEKNKDIEKTEDTPDNPDELKTHGTDSFDTLYIGCQFFDMEASNSVSTSIAYG